MEETRILYFDTKNKLFTSDSSDDTIDKFHSHHRIGYENGEDVIIEGEFKIIIHTNFYPKRPQKEFIYADIYVHNILLLPLSLACRKAAVYYKFDEHQIAFKQWGAGQNSDKKVHTIVLRGKCLKWDELFNQIIAICNNYKEWVCFETEQLVQSMILHHKTNFWDIAMFIELIRKYEPIVPDIINIYQSLLNEYCPKAIKDLVDYIFNHKMKAEDKVHKARCGDIIWNCIKDFKLRI